MSEEQKRRPTILDSGNQKLIDRVTNHIGEEFLEWTTAQVARYADGPYGGVDPRLTAAMVVTGEFFARGGNGPGRRKPRNEGVTTILGSQTRKSGSS